jgi:hypothetical protein
MIRDLKPEIGNRALTLSEKSNLPSKSRLLQGYGMNIQKASSVSFGVLAI